MPLAYIIFTTITFLLMLALDLRHFFENKKKRREKVPYEPKVLVIIPCRGRDLTLERNLDSIKHQKYGAFSIIAVVDKEDDSAIPLIKRTGINFIVSNGPRGTSSGKMSAILAAINKFSYEIYVIADSDIEVDQFWLKNLVAPLYDKGIGISTMFPYFNPVGGFWSKVKMVWGFVGESLLESESSRFGWGGSLAFRKALIDKWFVNLATNTKYGVSDDICITMAAKRKHLKIAYTNASQPIVNSNERFHNFVEWANRQTGKKRCSRGMLRI